MNKSFFSERTFNFPRVSRGKATDLKIFPPPLLVLLFFFLLLEGHLSAGTFILGTAQHVSYWKTSQTCLNTDKNLSCSNKSNLLKPIDFLQIKQSSNFLERRE